MAMEWRGRGGAPPPKRGRGGPPPVHRVLGGGGARAAGGGAPRAGGGGEKDAPAPRSVGGLSMLDYHDQRDMKLLKEMSKLSPEEFKAWLNLDNIVDREGGRIPKKYRQLIALAVAFTTQCPYCIEAHAKAAKLAGVSREE